jgi:hypothetical protein
MHLLVLSIKLNTGSSEQNFHVHETHVTVATRV